MRAIRQARPSPGPIPGRHPAPGVESSAMQTALRGDRIGRIERDIARFQERATELLRRERSAEARVSDLRRRPEPAGRLRSARRQRVLERAHQELRRRRDARETFVEQGLRAIMLTLEEQSRRTRERLDHELARLEPVRAEWDRLGEAFASIEATIGTPAVQELAGQWQGTLEIPGFPVHELEGYLRPFPHGALLF
jgi:hypothetical protein